MKKSRRALPKKSVIPLKKRTAYNESTSPKSYAGIRKRRAKAGPLRLILPRSGLEFPAPPLQVLMVLDQLNIGGTETYTLSLTRELLRKGASVLIAAKKGKLLEPFLGLGCPVYEIDFVGDDYERDEANRSAHMAMLQSIIRTEKIDLVHAHQVPSGIVALEAARTLRVPFLFTVHGTYYDPAFLSVLRRSATVTCVSPAVLRMLQNAGIQAFVVPNGVDPSEYHPLDTAYRSYLRRKLGLPQQAPVVMYASRLSWEKADICEETIHALTLMKQTDYPDLQLLIVGGGKKQDEIQQIVESKNEQTQSPFIHYAGEILNMNAYYSISDCVIGTGRISLEAMSCERPLIAVGSKGFCGLVKPQRYEQIWNCWFGDHDADLPLTQTLLTEHVRKALHEDRTDIVRNVRSGRSFVIDRFHISQTTDKLIDVYAHMLKSRKDARISDLS
ncbi:MULTISPECIES: glycosyltransferase [unclassified Paenibacillus]|nr:MULTISPECIES: glycosyltransferase [unclassified Paenibacillus]